MKKFRGLAPLEKSVVVRCDELMKRMQWTVIKTARRGGRGVNRTAMVTAGLPDRKYYKRDRTFWFECKAQDGRQSTEQKAFQAMCEEAGEVYVLGGFDELQNFLRSGVISGKTEDAK